MPNEEEVMANAGTSFAMPLPANNQKCPHNPYTSAIKHQCKHLHITTGERITIIIIVEECLLQLRKRRTTYVMVMIMVTMNGK
jgi:hypothetical protein